MKRNPLIPILIFSALILNPQTNYALNVNGTLALVNLGTTLSNANALDFDGFNDFVQIPNVVSGDFTVEYWMKTTSTGSGGSQWYHSNGIVDAEVGGVTDDWGTSLLGNKLAFGVGNPDVTIQSGSAVNTGNWVHVAASWKQSTGEIKLYINGVQEATQITGATALRSMPSRITFGLLQTNNQYYQGSLDEVRIWNEVRSLAQVQANMNKELNFSAEPILNAYYTFNQGIPSGDNTGVTMLIDEKNNNDGSLSGFTLTGATSNFVSQYSSLVILPLKWLSFTVQKQQNKALLNWSTASEQNTKDFIVQHSSNGMVWDNSGVVPAAGNSNTTSSYSFIHNVPAEGINFYRILQTDLDDRITYSEIRSIKFAGDNGLFVVLNNPVNNGVLQVKFKQPATVSLYNGKGNLLWKKEARAGTQTFNMSGYSKGIYFLKANGQSEKIVL
jgi:hypothetical protein